MKYKSKTNYFCGDCYKTYTEYWDGTNFSEMTKVYDKCDNCGGRLIVD